MMHRGPSGDGDEDGGEARRGAGGRSVVIINAFCGCGGNSIAFARLNERAGKKGRGDEDPQHRRDDAAPRVKVIAVDNNLSRLKMAANNAAV